PRGPVPRRRRPAMTTAAPWSLTENAPLHFLNTFHVAARAPRLLRVRDAAALPEALAAVAPSPLLVLGSGSNVLLAADPEGTVLCFDNREVAILEHRADPEHRRLWRPGRRIHPGRRSLGHRAARMGAAGPGGVPLRLPR